MRLDRRIAAPAPAFAAVALILAGPLPAQQFVTDDAGMAERGGCKLEVWAGEEETWILPACHLISGLEITAGASFTDLGVGSRDPVAVLEGKTLVRDGDVERLGSGVVFGLAVPTDRDFARPAEVYAYVPVTWTLETLPVVAHLNVGWATGRERIDGTTESDHRLMWGTKAGVELAPRIELVTEVFGLAGAETHLQAGLRTEVVDDRLTIDLSHGIQLDADGNGLGFQVGLAWTPRPIR